MIRYGEQMYEVAHTNALAIEERMQRLNMLGGHASLMCTDQLMDPQTRMEALTNVDWWASLPALEAKAKRQPTGLIVAAQVFDNLQYRLEQILAYEGLNYTKLGPDQQAIEGRLAELAVYGLLWHAAATRENWKDYSILPATKDQDMGERESGFRTGFDMMIDNGTYPLQPVQVKKATSKDWKSFSGKPKLPYHPSIAILRPYQLVGDRPSDATLLLIDALVKEDQEVLEAAHLRAESAISEAKARGRQYHRRLFQFHE